MAENDKGKPPVGETERSFQAGEEDGRQADLFSRGDQEGRPAPDTGKPDAVADDSRVLEAGGADGYQTDAFSRGDQEGVPQDDLGKAEAAAKGDSRAENALDGVDHKARDDADSRDAPPMPPREGGVR